jgi:hypothetical protein
LQRRSEFQLAVATHSSVRPANTSCPEYCYRNNWTTTFISLVRSSLQQITYAFSRKLLQMKKLGISCAISKLNSGPPYGSHHCKSCKVQAYSLKKDDDVGSLFQMAGHPTLQVCNLRILPQE